MRKLLAICAAVALFSGDCACGMENEDTQNLLQQTDSTEKKSRIRGTISRGVQKLKKLNPFKHKRYESQMTTNSNSKSQENTNSNSKQIAYIWKILNELNTQITANSQRLDNIQTQITQLQQANSQTNSQKSEDAKPKDLYKFVGNRLYYCKQEQGSKVYKEFATPTTVNSVTNNVNGILEIRYANDVSSDGKLDNPKVVLYRNEDKSCDIILKIENKEQKFVYEGVHLRDIGVVNKKYGIFYGVNGQNIELDGNSFSVYEVSEDIGSFTDSVPRLIYVDNSGLYIVSAEGNSAEDITEIYQRKGEFEFEGSIIRVSAIDGSITLDGKPITMSNFFDNWVQEYEVKKNGFEQVTERKSRTVLSTKTPTENQILRNFYPPKGSYEGIYLGEPGYVNGYALGWFDPIFQGKQWLHSLINKRLTLVKAKSPEGARELVSNGTFLSILSLFTDEDSLANSVVSYIQSIRSIIGIPWNYFTNTRYRLKSMPGGAELYKNPEYIKSLKSKFAAVEKAYEHNKESTAWILFEIVRNL